MPVDSKSTRLRSAVSGIPFGVWFVVILLAGGVIGLGTYTFTYAQGFSYASDDPQACANCHVMREVYTAWSRGSHRAVATCNDCHLPHALLTHYTFKAYSGFNHSVAFTRGDVPEPIRIVSLDRGVVEQNCLDCHRDMVVAISHVDDTRPTDCLTCHSGIGHWLAK